MTAESLLVWGAAAAFVVAVVGTYLFLYRRREHRERARLAEAQALGIDKPAAIFPYIDPAICIGCGGCVKACPEGDVLGLVGGLAKVINGARCVGIGQCAKACPVGAIELGLGDLKGRSDVPLLDDDRETTVPGVYVAGELGGLALIRNAIAQGRETVRAIAERAAAEAANDSTLGELPALDLAIIGAGPAGLAAALTATELGLDYAVFEQQESLGGTIFQYPRRKLTHTQPVELPLHGPLTRGEYSKEELLEIFQGLMDRHELRVRFGERVTAVEPAAPGFTLRTPGGEHRSRHVILALGRRGTPRKLGVPGEDLPKVMYQVRDAEEYRGHKILCVGGGDSAVEAAMGLARQPGNEVTLSYRKEKIFRIKKKNQDRLEKLVARGKIKTLMPSNVLEITPGEVRLEAPDGELTLANDYVFIFAGGIPPFPFLKEIGVRFGGEEHGSVAGGGQREV